MKPGRNIRAWSGWLSNAFSVRRLTRAHITRPRPQLSVPEPET
jgi:hypothetical protein